MADFGRLEADPLFLALTRPTMVVGVTYSWLMLEGGIGFLYFIQTSNFKVILYMIPLHVTGVLVCKKEPRFLTILGVFAKTNGKCKNRLFHGGTSSYDLY